MPEDVAIHVLFSKGCAAKPFSMDRDPNFIMLNPGSGLENFFKLIKQTKPIKKLLLVKVNDNF